MTVPLAVLMPWAALVAAGLVLMIRASQRLRAYRTLKLFIWLAGPVVALTVGDTFHLLEAPGFWMGALSAWTLVSVGEFALLWAAEQQHQGRQKARAQALAQARAAQRRAVKALHHPDIDPPSEE